METSTQNNNQTKDIKKRKQHDSVDLTSDDEGRNTNFPRFLVVSARDEQPIKVSIFGIQKLLSCAVGEVKEANKLRNGSVLIEVKTKLQADNALSMSTWVDQAITVTAHRSLNTSRGIIRCREFRDCDDVEVLNALSGQGVVAVKRLTVRRNGNIEATNTFVLTFALPTVPSVVKAAYMKLPVELYLPNPLRCFQCQKFGHGKSTCNRKQFCAKYAQEGHVDSDCPNSPQCANCGGGHTAYSRDCAEWQKQREITRVKFTRNISFGEAKQIVQQQSNALFTATKSYAQASTVQVVPTPALTHPKHMLTQSVEIQTDLTWPLEDAMPIQYEPNVVAATALLPVGARPIPVTAAAQTDALDASAMGAVSRRPPSPVATVSNLRVTTPSIKKPSQASPGDKAKPGPASSKGADKLSTKTSISNRPHKGSGDLVKLANRYSSLDEMAMDLGGASSTSPNNSKHK